MITFSSGVVNSSIIMASTVVATIVDDDFYEAFEDLQIIIDSTSIEGLAFSNQAINFTIQDPEGILKLPKLPGRPHAKLCDQNYAINYELFHSWGMQQILVCTATRPSRSVCW